VNNQLVKGANDRNESRGAKNISSNIRFETQDINNAKESLRLLKQKVTSTGTMNKFSGISNALGGLNSNSNIPNTSHDTRKYRPNLNNDHEEMNNKIQSNTLKPKIGGSNYSSNTNNKFNSTKPNVEIKSNQTNQPRGNSNRRTNHIQVEEVEDDRPAFVDQEKEAEIPEEGEVGELIECHGCGRKFREEALQKHAKACKKVFQSKRKAFDTKKKRIIDSEHAMLQKQGEYEEKNNPKLKQIKMKKNVNWKKQSEMLRDVAAANKTGADFMKKNSGNVMQVSGKNNAKSNVVPSYNDDLTFCNLCERKYNEEAYKKHLNHCQKKDRENKMKGKSSNSKVNSNAINSKPNFANKTKK